VKNLYLLLVFGCVVFFSYKASGQPDSALLKIGNSIDHISEKTLKGLQQKFSGLQHRLEHRSEQTLKRLQKQETRLLAELDSKDSVQARKQLATVQAQYHHLLHQLQSPASPVSARSLNSYIPRLDSLGTAMRFLQQGNKIPGIPADKLQEIQALGQQVQQLQGRLQQADAISQFANQQQNQLQQLLGQYNLQNQLLPLQKEAYYYEAQISEYKEMLKDPDKLAQKALGILQNQPAFQNFMARNSFLAQLFPMPSGYGTPQALAGLQTRTAIQQQIGQQFSASGGASAQQYFSQQVQQAQSQLSQLKDKINKLGGGSSDMQMPEFKPNNQKTKTFLQRLEFGFNIQTQKTNSLLPTTSDLALTVGYKLSDKATVGVGGSYKMGWGTGLNDIRISSQGLGLRSYVDIKLKGSIWISGGYEENYLQEFNSVAELRNFNAWQGSGLIGLSKKYKVGKKSGNFQVLYDMLYRQHVPQTQPLVFRIGYGL